MNKYVANSFRPTGLNAVFEIHADDSDMAVQKLSEMHRLALCPTAKYEIFLCVPAVDNHPAMSQSIGEVELTGFDHQQLLRDICEEYNKARVTAQRTYKCTRSRGRHIMAYTGRGTQKCLIDSEAMSFPTGAGALRALVKQIRDNHPDVASMCVCGGLNGADSLRDLNDGEYDPWVEEYSVEFWKSNP